MDRPLGITIDRVRRSRAAREVRENGQLSPLAGGPAARTRALEIGARVFDLVTGQEGEVIYGTRENLIVPTAERRNG